MVAGEQWRAHWNHKFIKLISKNGFKKLSMLTDVSFQRGLRIIYEEINGIKFNVYVPGTLIRIAKSYEGMFSESLLLRKKFFPKYKKQFNVHKTHVHQFGCNRIFRCKSHRSKSPFVISKKKMKYINIIMSHNFWPKNHLRGPIKNSDWYYLVNAEEREWPT